MKLKSLPMQYRMHDVELERTVVTRGDGDAAEERALYQLTFSSEAEVERWYGIEVLDHGKGAVDLTRLMNGAAVLVDHMGDQIGVVRDAKVDQTGRKGRATVEFSRSARGQEVERDVADGIRQNVSVGYRVQQMKLEEQRDGVDVYRVTRWQPMEVSIVSVPADYTVGVGRGQADGEHAVVVEGITPEGEDGSMKKRVRDGAGFIWVELNDPRTEVTDDQFAAEAGRSAAEAERQRIADIEDICAANGMPADFTREQVTGGKSLAEVARAVLAKRRDMGQPQSGDTLAELGLSKSEAKEYSYSRAILGALALRSGGKFDGLEAEVSKSLEARLPEKAQRHDGVFIPWAAATSDAVRAASMTRTLTSTAVGKGLELVGQQPGGLIELLRNYAAVLALGARSLTGLTAPVAFSKQTGAMTAQWLGEGATVTDSDIALAIALLSPKTLMCSGGFSRQLLMLGTPDAEGMVRADMAMVHALAWDAAAFHGLGAAGEPTGIYKAVGVSSEAVGGAFDYAKLLNMQGKVATANAFMGSLGFACHPTIATNLRAKSRFTNSDTPIWEGTYDDGRVGGYRAVATAQLSTTMSGSEKTGGSSIGAVFGNWNDMLIGSWGGLEIVVDPYSQKKKGIIEVTTYQLTDILIRHGESFCKATGATG